MASKLPGNTSQIDEITDNFESNDQQFMASSHSPDRRPVSAPLIQNPSMRSPQYEGRSQENLSSIQHSELGPHTTETNSNQGPRYPFNFGPQISSNTEPQIYATEDRKSNCSPSEAAGAEESSSSGNAAGNTDPDYAPYQRTAVPVESSELYDTSQTRSAPLLTTTSFSSTTAPQARLPSAQPPVYSRIEQIKGEQALTPPLGPQTKPSSSQCIKTSYPTIDQRNRELFGYYDPRNTTFLPISNQGPYMPDPESESFEQRVTLSGNNTPPFLEYAAAAAAAYEAQNERYGFKVVDHNNDYSPRLLAQAGSDSRSMEGELGVLPGCPYYQGGFRAEPRERSGGPFNNSGASKSISRHSRGPIRSVAALSGSSGSHAYSRANGGNLGRTFHKSSSHTNPVPFIPGVNINTRSYTTPWSSQNPSASWYWGVLPRDEDGSYRNSQGDAIPIQLCEPPLSTCTPPNSQALKADLKKGARKKSKYSSDQDALILSSKEQHLSWKKIAELAGIEKTISARNRYQVLIGQQGGGGYNWKEGQAAELVKILDEAERAKWDNIARELSAARGKVFTAEMCHYKITKMFFEDPARFGILRSRVPFILRDSSIHPPEDKVE